MSIGAKYLAPFGRYSVGHKMDVMFYLYPE